MIFLQRSQFCTILFATASLLTACSPEIESDLSANGSVRWYTAEQVNQGKLVFERNCAVCHGEYAEGMYADWKVKLADGSFPPPPLNGTAHAWHHPMSVLMSVINEGGTALGGKMPGFEKQLTDSEKHAAIAYFQHYWNDETYNNWLKMGGTD